MNRVRRPPSRFSRQEYESITNKSTANYFSTQRVSLFNTFVNFPASSKSRDNCLDPFQTTTDVSNSDILKYGDLRISHFSIYMNDNKKDFSGLSSF